MSTKQGDLATAPIRSCYVTANCGDCGVQMCTFGPIDAEHGMQRIKEETALALYTNDAEIVMTRPLWCAMKTIKLKVTFSTYPVPPKIQYDTRQGLEMYKDDPAFRAVVDQIELIGSFTSD